MSQKIKPEIYCALSHTVSTDTTRFYLLGIYLCPSENGGTIAVSTDGNKLAAYHMADVPCDEPVIVKVSKDMVRAARALIKANAKGHPVDHGNMVLDGDMLTIGDHWFADAIIGGTIAVSTDGNKLAAYHMADVPCDEPVIVKVSKDMVRAARALIKANAKGHPVDHGNMVLDGDMLTIGDHWFADAIIDGTFPDWQRLIPRPDQLVQTTVCVTPGQLNTFGVIAKDLGCNGNSVTLYPSGERGPIMIGLHDANFMGLLMPNPKEVTAPKIVRQAPRLEVVA